jgi:hypothetical protein
MARKFAGDSDQALIEHIKSNFLEEWTYLSRVDISIHLSTIQEQFAISAIKSFIDNDLQRMPVYLEDRQKFHLDNLAREAKLFADFLFVVTQGGAMINVVTIQSAKALLKSTAGTTTYPC